MAASQIILVPVPAQGHIPPMLYLSKKLAEEGFTVTIINIDSIHDTLQKSWLPTPGLDIRLESIPLELSIPNGLDEKFIRSTLPFINGLIGLEETLAELIKSIHNRGPKVACVISDFFHFSAAQSAQRAGFPSVAYFPGMAAWASIDFQIPQLISAGDVPVQDGDDKLKHFPGMTLRSQDFPGYLREPELTLNGGIQTLLYRMQRGKIDSRVLVNSVYDFEPEVFDAMNTALNVEFAAVGPLFPVLPVDKRLPVSLRVEDRTCLEWLDKQAPNSVLYVSFGSIAALPWEQFKELALGLEASKHHFLWVNRPGISDLETDREFYREFLERVKDRGLVTGWSPQLEVLQHGSTGGFLTHAGWNSVFESICAGVPMLGYPCLYDQFLNTKVMIEEKGLGLSLRRGADGVVSREEVENKVKALMEGSQGKVVRVKTEEFAKLARKAAEPGGSSHNSLKNCVRQFLPEIEKEFSILLTLG